MDKGNERITIGVLVGGIMDYFTIEICRGVAQMARTFDVDVVVLPGKYLNRDLSGNKELTYEYQFNTLFQYAKIPQIQGIIVAEGSIGCFANEEIMREMLSQYEGIPSVLIASRQEGYTTVNFDNRIGVREGMRYLIEQVNCKKSECWEDRYAIQMPERGKRFTNRSWQNMDFPLKKSSMWEEIMSAGAIRRQGGSLMTIRIWMPFSV